MNSIQMQDLIGLVVSFLYVFLFIGLADFLSGRGIVSSKTSRKMVHIGVSHWWLFAMFWMKNPFIASFGPAVFIFINWLSIQINTFRGMNNEGFRRNYGTVYFPISLLFLVLIAWHGLIPKWVAGTAILVLGWGDGLAALVGTAIQSPGRTIFGSRKSIAGTLTMFFISAVVVFIMTMVFEPASTVFSALWRAVGTGLVAAYLEVFSPYGTDNLTVPLGTAFYFNYLSPLSINRDLIFIFSVLAMAAFIAWLKKTVTTDGALAGLGLGTVIFVTTGFRGFVVLAAFFVSSTLIGHFRREQKELLGVATIQEKGDQRDALQVFANGGVGMVSAVLYAVTSQHLFLVAFFVSFAAATADTWASELGVLSRGRPRSIINLKPVERGISGGVSFMGCVASFVGSLFITALVFVVEPSHAFRFWGPVLIGGFMGSLVDSILGATLQAQYRCTKTGRLVERPVSDSLENMLVKGIAWINNDMVNFFSILIVTVTVSVWFVVRQG
ncbi:MAG: DUF92 domain-containing protein [Treponemataceae bacterium]|nr:DUF92 domain-containing protein [Treponemataceae bacterium]